MSEIDARPAPSQSDEAFGALVRDCAHGEYDGQNGTSAAIARGLAILAAVRAEATLAGAAAEREAIAKIADSFPGYMQPRDVAVAIRARK